MQQHYAKLRNGSSKHKGGTMRYRISMIMLLIFIIGCSTKSEKSKADLKSVMSSVITHELNQVEPEHKEEIEKWLNNARKSSEKGQYFTNSLENETGEYLYTYVYGEGYTDYEVAFIYNQQSTSTKGSIRISGIEDNSVSEHGSFVKIRSFNDLSILYILSDNTLEDKLKD